MRHKIPWNLERDEPEAMTRARATSHDGKPKGRQAVVDALFEGGDLEMPERAFLDRILAPMFAMLKNEYGPAEGQVLMRIALNPSEGFQLQSETKPSEKMAEQCALEHLREARACLLEAREDAKRGTRELSVTLTEIDTAILWLQHDLQFKAPVLNGEG
jgi:hypothetical protein